MKVRAEVCAELLFADGVRPSGLSEDMTLELSRL